MLETLRRHLAGTEMRVEVSNDAPAHLYHGRQTRVGRERVGRRRSGLDGGPHRLCRSRPTWFPLPIVPPGGEAVPFRSGSGTMRKGRGFFQALSTCTSTGAAEPTRWTAPSKRSAASPIARRPRTTCLLATTMTEYRSGSWPRPGRCASDGALR